MPEDLPWIGAVDGRRIRVGGVESLQSRKIDHHDVSGLSPHARSEHSPKRGGVVRQPGPCRGVKRYGLQSSVQQAVGLEYPAPDQTDDHQRQHYRQIQRTLVEPREAQPPVERNRQRQAQGDRNQDKTEDPADVVGESRREDGIVKEPLIVGQTDPLPLREPVPPGERPLDCLHRRSPYPDDLHEQGDTNERRDGQAPASGVAQPAAAGGAPSKAVAPMARGGVGYCRAGAA